MCIMTTTPGNGPLPSGRARYAWIWSPLAPPYVVPPAVIAGGASVLNEFHMVSRPSRSKESVGRLAATSDATPFSLIAAQAGRWLMLFGLAGRDSGQGPSSGLARPAAADPPPPGGGGFWSRGG